MGNLDHLHELYKDQQFQAEKANDLQARYEAGALSKESYEAQMKGVENTYDILGKEIEAEIENQGLSEQEYLEAKEEWQEQDQQHKR